MTIAEQLRKEGLQKGIEQGHAQGLEQGRRQALEKLMVLKFGPLSEAVAVRIRGADAGVVERWLERILVANTAEEAVELGAGPAPPACGSPTFLIL
jgi:flagellar biosynthesis/type III secretory pathway protein FliH